MQDELNAENKLFSILTETWLREHLDAELSINNYSIYRSDRKRVKKRRGRDSGGVAIYLRDNLAASAEPLLTFSNGVVEVLVLYVKSEHLVLCALYRQPDDEKGGNRSLSEHFKQALDALNKCLDSLPSPIPDIIIGGDFNLPKCFWPHCTAKSGASRDEQSMINHLSEFCSLHFLSQHIFEPTHELGNTLDLVLTNNPLIIHSYNITPTSYSPHHIVECTTKLSAKVATNQSNHDKVTPDSDFDTINLFSEETNWDQMKNSFLNHNWEAEFAGLSHEQSTSHFIAFSAQVAKQNAPLKKVHQVQSRSKIPRHRRILMRRRCKVTKQFKKLLTANMKHKLTIELRDIEKSLQASYQSQLSYEESKAVGAIKTNSKYFYAYAQRHNKLKSSIGPLLNPDGNYITNPKKIADMLSEQYQTAFSTPAHYPLNRGIIPSHVLEDMIFYEEDIIDAINELSPNSAPGPDRYPALLLKQCKQALAKPLYLIWRKSLDTGQIAEILKWSNITPIHKGGKRDQAINYRPVALTSHIIKVFEKVLRKCIVEYIEKHHLFNPNQHGFRSGHSCLSQLLAHYDKITQLLEEGDNVDVIYLDFSKAFDKLDFNITLQKLINMGISGNILRWITDFLTTRHQCVVVEGHKSNPTPMISGVPQGSVIGPLLFLILLGDIDEYAASSFVSSFADDTRVLGKISSVEDVEHLQTDLNAIYEWSLRNNMTFNSDKFELISYGTNQDIRAASEYKSDTGLAIEQKSTVKDLGVHLSEDCTFTSQIEQVAQSAKLKCGWILRTFRTRARLPMITLWKSLVQHIPDYCSQLWAPSTLGQILSLEMVLRTYLRKVSGLQHLSYWEQLKELKMYSIQRRHERYAIIYMWRILEGQVPDFTHGKLKHTANHRRGRSFIIPQVKPSLPKSIQNIRYRSLAIRGARLFNAMPQHIRNKSQCSTEDFKGLLDEYLLTVPDEPRIQGYTAFCHAPSNSLVDMVDEAKKSGQPRVEGPEEPQLDR